MEKIAYHVKYYSIAAVLIFMVLCEGIGELVCDVSYLIIVSPVFIVMYTAQTNTFKTMKIKFLAGMEKFVLWIVGTYMGIIAVCALVVAAIITVMVSPFVFIGISVKKVLAK